MSQVHGVTAIAINCLDGIDLSLDQTEIQGGHQAPASE